MSLSSQICSAERRLNRIIPIKLLPTLKMNIYSEQEWKYACPIKNPQEQKQSKWELNLVIEEKRPLM